MTMKHQRKFEIKDNQFIGKELFQHKRKGKMKSFLIKKQKIILQEKKSFLGKKIKKRKK